MINNQYIGIIYPTEFIQIRILKIIKIQDMKIKNLLKNKKAFLKFQESPIK